MNYEKKYKQTLAESEEEMIRKDIISYLRNEKIVKRYISDIEIDKWIAWLEKQGQTFTKKDVDDAYLKGVCDARNEIEKQGEFPRTDIEIPFGAKDSELQEVSYNIPKGFYAKIKDDRVIIKKTTFKVGNWVVKNGIVAKILDKQKYGFVGLDVDGNDFFCNYGHTDSMRLWNISDAKDGDVLLEEETGEPFIYNGNRAIYFSGYFLGAHCGICNGEFNQLGNNHHWGKNSYPATKEQRDLLFQKMKNAGYEWNAEKKELKKMKVLNKENEDEKIKKAIHIYLDWLDGRKDYQPKGVYTIRDMIDWIIKQDKKISADKVIAWLVANICDFEYYVKRFKQDFGL